MHNQYRYSFSLNQSNSQENVKKSFIIGFNFAEGRMLKEYALTVLKNYFTDSIESNQYNNSSQGTAQTEEKVENTAPVQDNTTEEDDGIPW